MNFKAGDEVTAFGNLGVVKRISSNGLFIEVNFPEFDSLVLFELDGRETRWHKLPSLVKVNEKKKISTFISTTEFLVGAFSAFVLTSIAFTFILTGAFVSKSFLKQNNIYLDGKMYQLCRKK